MPALRHQIINLNTLAVNAPNGQFDVFLDCWQWYLAWGDPGGNAWRIDGVDADVFFDRTGAFSTQLHGGYVDEKGKPVNFNSTLHFTHPTGAGATLLVSLVKVFYDHTLPQPE